MNNMRSPHHHSRPPGYLPMTLLSSRAVLDDEKCAPLFPTCPMCHTPASLTQNAIDAGADWWCVTCGQRWDATRLSAVAAYAAWVAERAVIGPEQW
jgi:hypothetical protein